MAIGDGSRRPMALSVKRPNEIRYNTIARTHDNGNHIYVFYLSNKSDKHANAYLRLVLGRWISSLEGLMLHIT